MTVGCSAHLRARGARSCRSGGAPSSIVGALLIVLAGCSPVAPSSPDRSDAVPPAPASAPSASADARSSLSSAVGIDPSELSGTLLFARAGHEFGDETLFTANADGSNDTRIGGFLAGKTTCCPRWTADGEHVAFVGLSPDERFTTGLVESDGANVKLFALPPGFEGACTIPSRETARLACEASGDAGDGIYTVDSVDGGDPRPVVTEVGLAIPMDFSPDGTQIVFIGEPVGGPTGVDPDAPVGSLYVVNVDGTGLHRLTPDGIYATSTARWSPDGRSILFGGLARTGDPLWIVRPDGTGFRELFRDDLRRGAGCPIWSPDGQFVLFCLNPPGSVATLSEAPRNGLYVIRADGTDLTPVIVTNDWKRDPDWSAVAGR